ncbi:MAG: hypothetical protein ACUVT9_06130 [Candidatus Bathycorpusculaceae bacterium]
MDNGKLISSAFISLVTVFAAFTVVCDSLVVPPLLPYSGVWHSWIFISEPITGIMLGPLAGFFSNLIGVMIGHSINFVDVYEFLFTLGAPIGAMISALIFRGKWGIALTYYLALFAGFFVVPEAWQLPPWGMWDVYLAFALLLGAAVLATKWKSFWNTESSAPLIYVLALSAFIGLEADVLFRIFIFVPCQTYRLFYGYDVRVLQVIWAVGAVETPIKAALSMVVTVLIGPPIISVARRMGLRV